MQNATSKRAWSALTQSRSALACATVQTNAFSTASSARLNEASSSPAPKGILGVSCSSHCALFVLCLSASVNLGVLLPSNFVTTRLAAILGF